MLKIVLFVTQIYDSKRIFSFSVKSSVNTVQYLSFFAGGGQQNDYYMRKRREQNAVKCRYDRMQNMSLCSISCEYNIVSKCRSTIQVLKVFQSQNVILGSLSFVSTSRVPGSEVVIDIFASSADLFTEELGYLDLLVRKFIKPFSCISKDINCVQRKSKCINAGHEHLNKQASVETRTCNPTIALQSLRRFWKILI